MNYNDAKANHGLIEYKDDRGAIWYHLVDRFPLWLSVAERPEAIYLDTGGPQGPKVEFIVVELRDDGYIWKENIRTHKMVKMQTRWRLAE